MTFLSYFLASALATVYFEERFGDAWESRWRRPDVIRKGIQVGSVHVSAGAYFGDERIQRGLETLEARRHYLLYSNFSRVFDTRGKDLIVQYTLRLDLYLDCAGQYIKIFPATVHPARFSNESEYSIMFGPDICGAHRQTHVILNHNDRYYRSIRRYPAPKDHLTHAYTLILRNNGTIAVLFDGEVYDQDLIVDRFNLPFTKTVPDPADVKPADWDDNPYIPDPEDTKPSNWVDEEYMPDPDAFRPPAWDDTIPWSPPLVKNPAYKGLWARRTIANPRYKGPWQPRTVLVKEEVPDPTFGRFPALAFLGLEFFQNAPGSIFDNFLVTDDEEYAREMLKEVFLDLREAELKSYDRMVNKITADGNVDHTRNSRIQKMKAKDALEDDVSDTVKEKETPEEKKKRIREAKRKQAVKRADQKAAQFADFDSL
jgi:calreticulin